MLAQKQADIWYFGGNAGLNFGGGTPPVPLLNGQINTFEGCATICDVAGNLLFYTDGLKVWNKNHVVMPNGNGLLGDQSSTQSAIITPYVGDKNKYYIFTTDGITSTPLPPLGRPAGPKGPWDGLNYSVVDMTLNGGLGDIVGGFKNRALVDTTREQVTAAKHANGIDYWIITRKQFTNKYYAFLVTCNGIDTANPVITVIGSTSPGNLVAFTGYLKASHNSDAILSAFMYGKNELYDFDNATGQLSNARILSGNMQAHYGASFSPNDSVLYIAGGTLVGGSTQVGKIFRYQRFAPSIPPTEIITDFPGSYLYGMQLAPDGKIYFSHVYRNNDSLGVIHNPNNYTNPNMQFNYTSLAGRTGLAGLPNYFDAKIFAPKTIIAGRDTSICFSTSAQIGSTPVAGLNYIWTPTTGIGNPTISNPLASPPASTQYILRAYNLCDTIYDTVMVNVFIPPIINLSGTSIPCWGSSSTLSVNATGPHAPYIYSWSNGQAGNTATNLFAGQYTVTITDSKGCTKTDTTSLTQPLQLLASIVKQDVICSGENDGTVTVIPSGGVTAYSYSWSHSALINMQTATNLIAGTYSVQITDMNGCTVLSGITITEPPPIIVNIVSPTTAICENQNDTLQTIAVGGNGAPYNYLWNPGTLTTSSIIVSPTVTTVYTVMVRDVNGCPSDTQTLTLTVYPLPEVVFSASDTEGCGPLCVNFINTTLSGSAVWDFGNDSTSIAGNPSNCYTTPGSYNVSLTITDNNGCSNTLAKNNFITVYPNPVAYFVFNPHAATILDPTVHFTDQSVGAAFWNWSFGDIANSSSSVQHPSFTYSADTGSYQVTLSVINEFGCSASYSDMITVTTDYVFYVPNTFTPNADGLNDIFFPVVAGIDAAEYDLYIFDRWGEVIFHSDSPLVGWDGRANEGNAIAQQDVYVWKLYTEDGNQHIHHYTGHVNLIR